MIELEDVLSIHELLIREFGGLQGIREMNLLKSAIERPFSGFGETAFYPSPEEKASAILESIVQNHPFIDGNKRTGYVLMRLTLMQFGKDVKATQDEKYDFIIEIASKRIDYQTILAWITEKAVDL